MFSLLARRAPNKVFLAMILGILSGVAYSLLIPLIGITLAGAGDPENMSATGAVVFGIRITNPTMAMVFATALLFVWASRTWVDVTMTRLSLAAASDLRQQMYDRIAHAPLAAIEQIGLPRLVTTIATDIPAVVVGAQTAQTMLNDVVTLIGLLAFLAYVDAAVFWFVLKCMVGGIVSYQVILLLANRYLFRAASINDTLQGSIHGLVQGFKELKLSDEKRREYFGAVLLATESELLAAQRSGNAILSAAANYGLMLNFLLLGAIAFCFVGYHAISSRSLSNILMVMLYISMPVGSVTAKIPGFTFAKVAIRRVNALLAELPQETVAPQSGRAHPWRSVRFENVTYEHRDKDGEPGFKVGPINLEFCKGEITFVVGGNGSGKSTLSKLLTLHYHAGSGAIYFGHDLLTGENMNSYRQGICAIYSDYHLFDRILTARRDQDLVVQYLRQLGLDEKVSYLDGRFSTLSLSDGQRRRMALVAALIEDRDLYLFDEWAADQDPGFKATFYRQILPSLKAKGKAVVVISHDDRFFDVADQLVVMCEGNVQSTDRAVQAAQRAAVSSV